MKGKIIRSSIYFLLIIQSFLVSCESSTREFNEKLYPPSLYEQFPYQLHDPDTTYTLSSKLVEISGLANYQDKYLLAIQDERGIVYVIDPTNGEIVREINFGGRGDYEGIEIVGNNVFVLNSNGLLYKFKYPDKNKNIVEAEEIETLIYGKSEMEGLCYHPESNSLLLASKEGGTPDATDSKGKSVFIYDLVSGELITKPFCSVTKKAIKKYVDESGITLPKKINFKPSAIAVHPVSNELYILTSTGKALLIMDSDENIVNFTQLNPYLFRQPEGLCFTSNGTMYISNEGSGTSAKLLKYSYIIK